ncbi:hypothetical protein PVK06_020690 [Gossypium arboreum]|uniref:Retrovirus-related Pol polyprotein from transposon TNT 1-94 n=1 Tax=Gossypium arboreum TaxID=29729 RepID=A0ABR0PN23_GOSAR|nr:hypothetical protein PVK06_020690 [Gossypium arboreum]
MAIGASEYQKVVGSSSTNVSKNFINKNINIHLDEINYPLWKQHVSFAMESYGLESYIDGTQAIPPEFVSNEFDHLVKNRERVLFNKQDKDIASWLLSVASLDILPYLVKCQLATEIWEVIGQLYYAKTTTNIMNLRQVYDVPALSSMLIDLEARQKSGAMTRLFSVNLATSLYSSHSAQGHKQPTEGMSSSVGSRGVFISADGSSAFVNAAVVGEHTWFPDSEVTSYLTRDASKVSNSVPYTGTGKCSLADSFAFVFDDLAIDVPCEFSSTSSMRSVTPSHGHVASGSSGQPSTSLVDFLNEFSTNHHPLIIRMDGNRLYLLVYVDDIVITGDSQSKID